MKHPYDKPEHQNTDYAVVGIRGGVVVGCDSLRCLSYIACTSRLAQINQFAHLDAGTEWIVIPLADVPSHLLPGWAKAELEEVK